MYYILLYNIIFYNIYSKYIIYTYKCIYKYFKTTDIFTIFISSTELVFLNNII